MNAALQQLAHRPDLAVKYIAIRRRIISHNPMVIRPLRSMHRAVLSSTLYANASR